MTGRTTFSRGEAAELRRLILAKQTADRTTQKALRSDLRAHGFYISDFGDFGSEGFTVCDFDELVQRRLVTITDEGGILSNAPSNSVAEHVDSIDLQLKKTGVAAHVEIIAYADGHAAIGTHPLNDRAELITAIGYLFDRAQMEAAAQAASR